jgi:hypothetical protein
MILYYYAGAWQVATSGMPDAGGEVNGFGMTFAELFWKTFNTMGLKLPDYHFHRELHRGQTFMFELTSPMNRVVVQHSEAKLVLIGLRWREGLEGNVDAWDGAYPVVRSFSLQSVDDILATFEAMDPVKQEGYVVVDGNFNRVKMKCPAYVALHHMKDGFSTKRLLSIVQTNEGSEFLAHFPEWASAHQELMHRYNGLVSELEATYERIAGAPDQKSFALEAVKTRFSAPLFMLRKGQETSVRQCLKRVHLDTLADLLQVGSITLDATTVS